MDIPRMRTTGSLFKKFFIMISAAVLFCLVFSSIFLLMFYVNFWNSERIAFLSDDALSLAQSVEALSEENSVPGKLEINDDKYALMVAGTLYSFSQSSDIDMFIMDADGKVVLCKENITISETGILLHDNCPVHSVFSLKPEIMDNMKNGTDPVYTFNGIISDLFADDYFLASAPVRIAGNEPYYVVAMQSKSEAYLPYTTSFVRMLLFVALIAVFISCLASLVISVRIARPIQKVTKATKQYAGGDFSARIETSDTYKELWELVDSVNTMAGNLALLEESRSNFVTNVSHELKTPMTIIGGFVDGMLDGTIPEEDHEKYLAIVSDEVRRLSRLVVAMLNMSKIQAGKLTLNYSDVDLYELICKIFISFESVIDEKKLNISGFEDFEQVSIRADDTLINQIFYNLIDNAVKFTPDGGAIAVSLTTDKKNAYVTIRNTGKGLSEEECSLVFDRFYKADKSRGLDSKSFGMGLYIVRSIIELHNGSISINSRQNEYTEFDIRLPL